MAPVSGGEPDTGAWDFSVVLQLHSERQFFPKADIQSYAARIPDTEPQSCQNALIDQMNANVPR